MISVPVALPVVVKLTVFSVAGFTVTAVWNLCRILLVDDTLILPAVT